MPDMYWLIAVSLMAAIDIITGFCAACATASFVSRIMREGLWHKISEVLAMVLMYGCQILLPRIGIDLQIPYVQAVGAYLIVMEIGSCMENLCKINPDLQGPLGKISQKLRGDKDGN